ncbi:uncharacterized protein DNG_08810 [Cephalotrichum gorgonifer]|uniref:Helix-turn-helix domain-containing protein n=1 Tax=Cephalotrichum gorgonifer TaxID=2041049 RepID=A0AAE8SYP8_9PEZI|nr:uncharacterized protein DNG_08810 [Cephalotrichum gorgonifer]
MGSAASKTARTSHRRFPGRTPGSMPVSRAPRQPDPTGSAKPTASTSKTEEIISDSIHPHPDGSPAGFADRLHRMGIVNPTPTFSASSRASHEPAPSPRQDLDARFYPSPANNPTLASLEARRHLQERADAEFEALGRRGSPGREFLDVITICRALAMREKGTSAEQIESRLNLKAGVVARLGPPGVTLTLGASS